MLDTLSTNPVHWGSQGIPCAEGRYGIMDSLRLQEVAVPGQAIAYENSASGDDYLNVYVFGNALARSEFFGVLVTKGSSPTMALSATTTNDNTVSAVYQGYAPCGLAPGYAVRAGQFMEPIPSGLHRGHFRPVNAGGRGPVMAVESYDNSAGTAAQWVGGFINPEPVGAGVLGSVGPSATVTGVAVETAYSTTVTIPANTFRVGDRYRVSGYARGLNGAAGNNTIKGYINGIGSTALFTSPAVTFIADDVCRFSIDIRIDSLGAPGTMETSGGVGFGTAGTATMRAQGSAGAVNITTTAANVITIAVTPNNNADQSRLEDLLVEKLN